MTKEDLIAMAGEAGFPDCKPENHPFVSSGDIRDAHEEFLTILAHFASLVSARTREECAGFCDEFQPPSSCNTIERHLWNVATVTVADGIRAMGERT